MLSSVFLSFKDKKIKKAYQKEKKVFYNRVMPLITCAMIALLVAIEVIYRVQKMGEISNTTTIINAVYVGWFCFLTCFSKCWIWLSKLVCPSLIGLVFYYIIWIEYDTVNVTIFYKTVIGITILFFLLVIFNEAWVLTCLVYWPFVCYFMYKSGFDMLEEKAGDGELAARCIFLCIIFAIVAY